MGSAVCAYQRLVVLAVLDKTDGQLRAVSNTEGEQGEKGKRTRVKRGGVEWSRC